jgi:hypothetical protein
MLERGYRRLDFSENQRADWISAPLAPSKIRFRSTLLESRPANVEAHLLQGLAAHVLERVGLPRVGTHGIRHRSATATMFMRYVHTEDDPVRLAAEAVASRRQGLIGGAAAATAVTSVRVPIIAPDTETESRAEGDKPPRFEDGNYKSRTKVENYRPFRHRGGSNRPVPPGTKRAAQEPKQAADARG